MKTYEHEVMTDNGEEVWVCNVRNVVLFDETCVGDPGIIDFDPNDKFFSEHADAECGVYLLVKHKETK